MNKGNKCLLHLDSVVRIQWEEKVWLGHNLAWLFHLHEHLDIFANISQTFLFHKGSDHQWSDWVPNHRRKIHSLVVHNLVWYSWQLNGIQTILFELKNWIVTYEHKICSESKDTTFFFAFVVLPIELTFSIAPIVSKYTLWATRSSVNFSTRNFPYENR